MTDSISHINPTTGFNAHAVNTYEAMLSQEG